MFVVVLVAAAVAAAAAPSAAAAAAVVPFAVVEVLSTSFDSTKAKLDSVHNVLSNRDVVREIYGDFATVCGDFDGVFDEFEDVCDGFAGRNF